MRRGSDQQHSHRSAAGGAIGRGLVIACLICAPVIAGCGGSSGKSPPPSTSTPAVVPAGGATLTAPHFTASRPAHWTNGTGTATVNPNTGRAAEMQLLGPASAGERDVIRVDALSLDAVSVLRSVVEATRGTEKAAGDTFDPSGVRQTTVGGESAFEYGVHVVASNGNPQRHDLVFVRHGKVDLAIVFVAPAAAYDRDLPLFESYLSSMRFSS